VLGRTLRSLSVEPRLTGRVVGLVAHVLSGGGVQCLVATNVSGQIIEADLGVLLEPGGKRTEGKGRGGKGTEGTYRLLDLLTGATIHCRREEGRLVVPIRLPPAETGVLPLLPVT
jgi:hypothetical protein